MKSFQKWTDAATDLLRKLWADGYSCSIIAEKIGGVTRNAVIGRAHRLNLPGRNVAIRSTALTKYGDRPKPRRNTLSSVSALPKRPRPKKIPARLLEPPPPPVSLMVSLLDLSEKTTDTETCKFPMGAATGVSQLFCGAPKPRESSYCAYHHRLCWEPHKAKQRPRVPFRLPRRVAA